MLSALTRRRLVPCTLLLLAVSSCGRPGAPGGGASRALLLEAVKAGILSSLGMDRAPAPAGEASAEELRRMFRLYEDTLAEMRGNASRRARGTSPRGVTTVLAPATVETVKPHPGGPLQWHRAVFHKSPTIRTERTVARAELRISWRAPDRPASAQREARGEVKVKVNSRRPANSAPWTHTESPRAANASGARDALLDIRPEVERWMRTGGDRALLVDVGMTAADGGGVPAASPTVSLELGLGKARRRRRRPRRSDEEDDACDERGWCCRRSVTVSFEDVGWSDWVVAPSEYSMHLCDGACPRNYKPASMHTQLKSRLHQFTKGGTPRPCCVPAAYEPMVLMHYDSRGELKLTPFDNFIVSGCHCA